MDRPERFVIIGADAAGMSAASEARRVDPNLEIVAYDRGGYASYSQCGMPYLLGGVVKDRERLIARSVEEFERRGIEARLGHEVTEIDAGRRVVRVLGEGGETEEPYDRLLISTGASPVTPPVPGLDLDGVFHLDVMEDAIAIQSYIREHRPERAVIVGGGYIGLEMAENLRRLGLRVSVIERGDQLFPSVDVEIGAPLDEELDRHGVDLSLCGSVLSACEGRHGRVVDVQTDEESVPADLVILATGVKPNVELARAAGVSCGPTGAVAVDDRMLTDVPGVFAAGDCAEHRHRLLDSPAWVPLGTTANKQGRVAGRNAAGGDARFAGIVGTAIARVFDVQVGRTGLSEREARAADISCVSTTLDSRDRAGYMPDASPLTIKLVADSETGRLLGGQAVGRSGVDKRIDVLATALYAGLTVEDLTRLDLEYAPPFNGVWDPIQVAATSLLRGGLPVGAEG
jgi:NADPH-dependent 2,4-dienoyl-CoA reductase/sulfur reductase-like enzyme